MPPRRRVAAFAAAAGIALFLVACALPRIGLARGGGPAPVFQLYGDRAAAGKIPYRDYSLEYPPGALAAIVPPSLAAADRYSFWFKALEIFFGCACVALVGVCLALLRVPVLHAIAATAFVALAPLALGSVVLERFDLWPTALMLGGLAALLGGRAGLGGAALGLGTVTKLFPVLLLPLGLLYLARRA